MHSGRGPIDLCDRLAVRRDLKSQMQRGLRPTLHLAKLKLICYANPVFANPFFGSQRDADAALYCSLPETTLYSQITRTFPRARITLNLEF
jgi:hypothetical protein